MSNRYFSTTREIGIDAAHRVPTHGSKCQHIHGHRYTIQVTCSGTLQAQGVEAGMVLDFGVIKEAMMAEIDAPADHAMIAWDQDPFLEDYRGICGKLLIIPCIPTAENLAKYWFEKVNDYLRERGAPAVVRIRVLETPNCWADYPS